MAQKKFSESDLKIIEAQKEKALEFAKDLEKLKSGEKDFIILDEPEINIKAKK